MLLRYLSLLCFGAILLEAGPKAPEKQMPSFSPFTGKLIANKVRMRAGPDLESSIVRRLNKNDLLLVVGEENGFYVVNPLKDTKAYVFRSYVLDGIVEANRVNVRLEPHVDAPIIAKLKMGERVDGTICASNRKWLEITPPKETHFYVAKDFIKKAGGPGFLAEQEKRREDVEELLNAAYQMAEAECKKEYEEMAPQHAIEQFQRIMKEFADFPKESEQAKEGLALLKETYLNKKIAYLEAKAEITPEVKKELLAKHKQEKEEIFPEKSKTKSDASLWSRRNAKDKSLGFWDTLEESLYLSWSAFHSGETLEDFYLEQKANASVLKGTIELYDFDVRNKPGDFLLKGKENVPLAYLYSTEVDLKEYVGKTVTLLASPRPNNHFAFPAYFVFSVEK